MPDSEPDGKSALELLDCAEFAVCFEPDDFRSGGGLLGPSRRSRAEKARNRGWAVLPLESLDELAPDDVKFVPDTRPRAAGLLRAHPDRARRPRLWIAAEAFDATLEQERW